MLLLTACAFTPPALAQSASTGNGKALSLTVRTVGISIGDSERTTGLRLNYRDRRLRRVTGINLTLWRPYDLAGGTVNGMALGLPLTGGKRLREIGIGGGLSGETALDGLFLGGLGLGSGRRVLGMAVGGLGVDSANVTGVAIAGGYSRVEDGLLRGISTAVYNDVRGTQHGLTIGLYNYTRVLHGVQIGLLNVVRNNPLRAHVLPILNLKLCPHDRT